MKRIVKIAEPAELLAWKNTDKKFLKGLPEWKRIPSQVKDIVRISLREEQGFICCYCERYMQDGDFHIEHVKPQGISATKQFLADYDNMICSCQFEEEKGAPRHCGNSKGSWYDPALFISPLDPTCEERFEYTFDGLIEPVLETDQAASVTIERLQLNIDKIKALRSSAIEPFLDDALDEADVKAFAEGYLVDKANNLGRFNQFYTTIKYLFT